VHTADGDVSVTIGEATLPVANVCVQRYSAIRGLDGQGVVVGIRAEDAHPAAARPELPTMDARVELVEALGSGLMVYLAIDATPVRPAGADEMEAPSGNGEGGIAETRPNLIAHFPPRIDLRIAETIPVALDTAGLHFFDRETGAALR
jgi:multiple sugar transport system ATP-binding protein